MKKIPYILFLAATLLSACGGDNPEPLGPASADMLRLSPRDVSMEAAQQASTFEIEANCDWNISIDATWEGLIVSPLQGNGTQTVTIASPANPYNVDRQARFTVTTSDGISTRVGLTQAAGEVALTLSTQQLDFLSLGESKAITVQSNVDWTVTTSAEWVTTSKEGARYDSDIDIACQPNTSEQSRDATVSFWYDGVVRQLLTLHQYGGTRPAINHVTVGNIGRSAVTVSFVCTTTDFPITECGVWWGTGSDPRESGSRQVAQADGEGNVVVRLEGLPSATEFHVVPYAINAVGETWADIQHFQTLAIPGKDDNTPPSEQ